MSTPTHHKMTHPSPESPHDRHQAHPESPPLVPPTHEPLSRRQPDTDPCPPPLPEVALEERVLRLEARAVAAERAVEGLSRMLGLGYEPPETRPEEVRRKHLLLRELVGELQRGERQLDAEEVLGWAEEMLRLTSEQLSLIQQVSDDPEPWVWYQRLAELVLMRVTRKGLERDRWVYGLLDTGRRAVLEASYMLVRGLKRDTEGATLLDGGRDGRVGTQLRAMVAYLRERVELPAPLGQGPWGTGEASRSRGRRGGSPGDGVVTKPLLSGSQGDEVDQGDSQEDFT